MNFKYILAVAFVICLLPAAYYSLKETPAVPKSDFESVPIEPEEAPNQSAPVTRKPAVPDDVLEERRVEARIEAIDAMENLNDSKTLAALGDALADPNPEVKDVALQALAERKGADATAILRRGLADPDPEFRIEVLEVLAERGDSESLRRAKSDPDQEVRDSAADLLESTKN
jgi:hypothetical protein